METNERKLLRKPDAAKLLGDMPVSTLEKLTRRKQIPHVKIGTAVYYDSGDLWAWIESKKTAALASN
jgi:predicted DNA-binding transcriptional regulator AlpA